MFNLGTGDVEGAEEQLVLLWVSSFFIVPSLRLNLTPLGIPNKPVGLR